MIIKIKVDAHQLGDALMGVPEMSPFKGALALAEEISHLTNLQDLPEISLQDSLDFPLFGEESPLKSRLERMKEGCEPTVIY